MNVRAFGAVGDGEADDTAAIASAVAAAESTGRRVFFPAGVYVTDPIAGLDSEFVLSGEGPGKTTIRSRSGSHVVEVTGKSINSLTIRDLHIQGTGAGSGHGIYEHGNAFVVQCNIENVYVTDCGGKGIYLPEAFSSSIRNVRVNLCGDNAIEANGGPAVVLENVYVENIAQTKCGYRFYSGSPTLINCNGINGGTVQNLDWGVFGRSAAEDGTDSYCFPVFVGCNVEAFTRYGIRFKTGSCGSFFGTSFYSTNVAADAAGVPIQAVAIQYDNSPHGTRLGIFDGASSIATQGAGAWKNGYPVHGVGNPFVSLNGSVATIYNDAHALPCSVTTLVGAYASYATYSLSLSGHQLSRFRPAPATATAAGEPGDWSSDGAYLYACHAKNAWRRVAITTW